MTTGCKVSSLLPFSSLTFSTMNSRLSVGDVTAWEKSSPNLCTASDMYSLILIYILLFLSYLIFVPMKGCASPSLTVNPGNISSTSLMKSSITSCYTCETLLSSTYQEMLHCFTFMSLLVSHMS